MGDDMMQFYARSNSGFHPFQFQTLGVLLVSLSIGLVSILLPPLLIFFSIAAIAFIQTGAALKSLSVLREKDAGRTADEMRQPGR